MPLSGQVFILFLKNMAISPSEGGGGSMLDEVIKFLEFV